MAKRLQPFKTKFAACNKKFHKESDCVVIVKSLLLSMKVITTPLPPHPLGMVKVMSTHPMGMGEVRSTHPMGMIKVMRDPISPPPPP